MNNENIVQKLWSLCNILRGDGISYHEYKSDKLLLHYQSMVVEG